MSVLDRMPYMYVRTYWAQLSTIHKEVSWPEHLLCFIFKDAKVCYFNFQEEKGMFRVEINVFQF